MDITHIEIGPSGARNALRFHAVTTTVGGKRITAHVTINAGTLHHQMIKATKNRSRRSHDGPVDVIVGDVQEVSHAL